MARLAALAAYPVAAATFGVVAAAVAADLRGKALHAVIAAAVRGAATSGMVVDGTGLETAEAGGGVGPGLVPAPLDQLEAALEGVQDARGLPATPNVTAAKSLLREAGHAQLASRAGKLSKLRNGVGHRDIGLMSKVSAALRGDGAPAEETDPAPQHKKVEGEQRHIESDTAVDQGSSVHGDSSDGGPKEGDQKEELFDISSECGATDFDAGGNGEKESIEKVLENSTGPNTTCEGQIMACGCERWSMACDIDQNSAKVAEKPAFDDTTAQALAMADAPFIFGTKRIKKLRKVLLEIRAIEAVAGRAPASASQREKLATKQDILEELIKLMDARITE